MSKLYLVVFYVFINFTICGGVETLNACDIGLDSEREVNPSLCSLEKIPCEDLLECFANALDEFKRADYYTYAWFLQETKFKATLNMVLNVLHSSRERVDTAKITNLVLVFTAKISSFRIKQNFEQYYDELFKQGFVEKAERVIEISAQDRNLENLNSFSTWLKNRDWFKKNRLSAPSWAAYPLTTDDTDYRGIYHPNPVLEGDSGSMN